MPVSQAETQPELQDCSECCNSFEVDDLVSTDNGEVCQSCLDDHYRCTGSGNYIHSDVAVCINDEIYHVDDTTECANCCERFPDGDGHAVYNGEDVCDSCLEGYSYCIDIEQYVADCDCHWHDGTEEYYLELPDRGPLRPYDTNIFNVYGRKAIIKNKTRALNGNTKTLLFGAELETDSRNGNNAHSITEAIEDIIDGWAICKEDSTCTGPEIVSLPADLESHKTIGWTEICERLRPLAKGHHGSDNGMHVHISLNAIGQLTLGKMLVFVNAPQNTDLMGLIAQRRYWENTYCKANLAMFDKVGKAGKSPRAGKFHALNVTANTVECRIFKSSLLPERILKNIEFCHALVRWCENQSAKNLTSDAFASYIHNNRKTYKNLDQFITSRSEA